MTEPGKFVHIGTRSWWNGTITTLCGKRYKAGDKVRFPRFFSYAVCPDCQTIHDLKERLKKGQS